jgi:thioredoxin reductase (NADPH)
MIETDVFLVGAGPIGLELAVALSEAKLDYIHVDARQIGHTISWFPRQARFFSSPERIAICGVPLLTVDQSKASREEYLAYLLSIAAQFQLPLRAYERVVRIDRLPSVDEETSGYRFVVTTHRANGEHQYRCRHVVLAIGDMHLPRTLQHPTLSRVPGADLPHVHAYFIEPHPYVGQHLLIIGGRNSAVEAAIRCYRAGAKVAISYRRDTLDDSIKYWLKPEIQWLIENGQIDFYPSTLPITIEPDHVVLVPTQDGVFSDTSPEVQQRIPADFVLPLIGFQMDMTLFEQAGVELVGETRAPRVDLQTMQTNVPGLFIAGTAAAGTQLRYRLFIENCHSHVLRIVHAICGKTPTHINPLAYADWMQQREEVAES